MVVRRCDLSAPQRRADARCRWWNKLLQRPTIPVVATALIVSGVVGNLIDRVFLGSVRDFLAFPGNTVANVADLALAAGLLGAVAALIVGPRQPFPPPFTDQSRRSPLQWRWPRPDARPAGRP